MLQPVSLLSMNLQLIIKQAKLIKYALTGFIQLNYGT